MRVRLEYVCSINLDSMNWTTKWKHQLHSKWLWLDSVYSLQMLDKMNQSFGEKISLFYWNNANCSLQAFWKVNKVHKKMES